MVSLLVLFVTVFFASAGGCATGFYFGFKFASMASATYLRELLDEEVKRFREELIERNPT